MPFASLVALISPPMIGKYSVFLSILANLGMTHPFFLVLLISFLCWRYFLAEIDNGFQAITSCALASIIADINGNLLLFREGRLRYVRYLLCKFLRCHGCNSFSKKAS